MKPRLSRRAAFVIACFGLALALALFADDGDRGWRFAPGAAAKTDRSGTYDLAKARMLARVVGHIRAHYVAPERVDPKVMAVAALERVQLEVPEVRVETERAANQSPRLVRVTVGDVTREFGLDKVNDLYELNWKLTDVFAFFERHLPPQVDLEALEYAAINGLLSTLDPHTVLLPPRVYRELQLSQKGRFGGLGITVGDVDGSLVVQGVMRDTPAAEAGLQAGDHIAQIGGESAINMDLDEAINLLRGEPGSQVTLWIRRDGWPVARPFTLSRREIQIPSVEHQALGHGIGYVVVRGFQESTDQDLEAALDELDKVPGGLQGLVLDLRDNPGGLLDKAIAISDVFLSSGTVVTTVREGGREREESHATMANTRAQLPLVVLVNKGSASASEIVAGALKRNDRALVIGQRTFGKGSVQVVYRIDEAALKLTIAQYLTPGDVSIQGVGIVPDIDLQTIKIPGGHGTDGALDLLPTPEDQGGERALQAHLSSDKTRNEVPAVILRLLDDAKTPTHRQPRGAEKLPDASVLLAVDILRQAPSPLRKQALVQLTGFLAERQKLEDQRITTALAPAGVDWRAGPEASAKAPIAARLEVVPARGDGEAIVAGGKALVRLTLDNPGKRPLHRVFAELDSSLAAFDNKELAFGVIEPGQSVTKDLSIVVPPGTPSAGDRIVARLHSDRVPLDASAAAVVRVAPRPAPVFGHTLQVRDPQGAHGNGDGLIQRGEKVTLAVWVTNLGRGPAEALLATLKNQAGPDVYLSLGRREPGRLEPGQTVEVTFELEVLPTLESRVVELELGLSDMKAPGQSSEATTATLALPVHPDGMPRREPAGGLIALGTAATLIHGGAHREALPVAEALPSSVLDVRGRAGDWLEVTWSEPGSAHADKDAPRLRTGWVALERGRLASEGAATADAVVPVVQVRPPVVTFEEVPTTTSEPEVVLTGEASFGGRAAARRMVYVFRGRQKIWFGAADAKATARDALPFKVAVPLEPGRNEVVVYAREGDARPTRTSFIIHRL
ncbi:MAG: PDZ domain-containing protein [Deltaproteobacteria bacterium]|nr:PDZ domain-containing protein [Deltaproteobacteria bacterium]